VTPETHVSRLPKYRWCGGGRAELLFEVRARGRRGKEYLVVVLDDDVCVAGEGEEVVIGERALLELIDERRASSVDGKTGSGTGRVSCSLRVDDARRDRGAQISFFFRGEFGGGIFLSVSAGLVVSSRLPLSVHHHRSERNRNEAERDTEARRLVGREDRGRRRGGMMS